MDGQHDGSSRSSWSDHRTSNANEVLGPNQPAAVRKIVTEEPRKRKQSSSPAGGPGEMVPSSSHHASDRQQPKNVKFSLPTVKTSRIDLGVAKGREAKGKEKAPRHSVEDDERAAHSIAVEMAHPLRNLYFLVRDLEDSSNYHRAIYLRERSLPELIHGILQKFHSGSGNIAMLSFENPAGARVIIDDDVMLQLPNGKDLVVEFERAELSDVLMPVPGLHTFASTAVNPEHDGHIQSTRIHSRGHSESTETRLGSIFSTTASEATCSTPDIPEYARSKVSSSSISTTEWGEPATILNPTLAADTSETLRLDFPGSSQWIPKIESVWHSSPLLSLKTSPTRVAETGAMAILEPSKMSTKSLTTSAPGGSASPIIKLEHKRDPAPLHRSLQLAKEEKKAEMLEKNRVAASKCRGKKKMAEANLKDELRDRTQENLVLHETVRRLQGQADALNVMVAEHGACMDHEHFSTASNSFSAFEHADLSTNEFQAGLPPLFDDHWHESAYPP